MTREPHPDDGWTPALEREQQIARTFVRLADSLVAGFDVVELLDDLVASSVDLLGLAASGLVMADQRGALRVMASSSEKTRMLELLELQSNQGPCLDCYHTQAPVAVADEAEQATRWPAFAAMSHDLGFGAVYALPMQLRYQTIGALNLFMEHGHALNPAHLDLGQALADVATIALLQHRARHADQILAEQLQTALNTRVVIEQAKGFVASHAGVEPDTAFAALRRYARSNSRPLSDVARSIVSGELDPAALAVAPADTAEPRSDRQG